METPLSYLFWHWPISAASARSYETRLRSFQRALASDKPRGLIETLSFRIDRLPWEAKPGSWYEDWYLVKNFTSLGAINRAAVTKSAASPHDSIAMQASGGTGGVYRRIRGGLPLRRARFAAWFQKPMGFTYQSLWRRVDESVLRPYDLWQRQLTLGPAPEFCIHSEGVLQLPIEFGAIVIDGKMISHG
jgi:hypothetical protein